MHLPSSRRHTAHRDSAQDAETSTAARLILADIKVRYSKTTSLARLSARRHWSRTQMAPILTPNCEKPCRIIGASHNGE